jgi:hypothetical protein
MTHDMISCWKFNYGLDTRTPADAMRYWDERCNGMAPAGAVAALGLCIEHIERLRAELDAARRDAEQFSYLLHRAVDMLHECGLRDEIWVALEGEP